MKIKFEVECTPAEARQSLGLPDVAALQDRMLSQIEAKMHESLSYLDPETLMKTWLPVPIPGWGEMQKMFLSQLGVKPGTKGE